MRGANNIIGSSGGVLSLTGADDCGAGVSTPPVPPFIADLEAEIDGLLPLLNAYLADAPISHDLTFSRGG